MVSNAKGHSDSVDRRFLNFFIKLKEVNTNRVKDDSEELEDTLRNAELNSDKRISNKVTNGLDTNQKQPVNESSESDEIGGLFSTKNVIESLGQQKFKDEPKKAKTQKLQSKSTINNKNQIMHGWDIHERQRS